MEIKDILQGEYIIKFRESLRLRCHGHGEKTAKPKIAKKKIAIPRMEGRRKAKYHVKEGETRFKRM